MQKTEDHVQKRNAEQTTRRSNPSRPPWLDRHRGDPTPTLAKSRDLGRKSHPPSAVCDRVACAVVHDRNDLDHAVHVSTRSGDGAHPPTTGAPYLISATAASLSRPASWRAVVFVSAATSATEETTRLKEPRKAVGRS